MFQLHGHAMLQIIVDFSDRKPKKTEKSEEIFFLRGDFRQFPNKNVHIWDHVFPVLFPKDSESLKILDIRLWKVGAKRPLIGTSKVNRQTTTTFRHRKHRPRGPMLWKLDGVGPIDNRPSTNKLHHFVQKKKCYTWHVTRDMWHVTHDMWPVACLGGKHSLKISAP